MKTAIVISVRLAALCVLAGAAAAEETMDDAIRVHRMGTIEIRTTPGARVTVKQQRHAFRFGTAVSQRAFREGRIDPEDREKYLATLKANFNCAVHENAMKWYSTERTRGRVSYEMADRIWQWCDANGIRMRGHCVFWAVEKHVQDWQKDLSADELRAAVRGRATDLVTHFKGRIDEFDVNNEMAHGNFYVKKLGPDIRVKMFRWCREANPDAILYVNDYNILTGGDLDKYCAQIEGLIEAGAPVGGIGLQGHFHERVDAEKVRRVLDRLSRFDLPITVTEFDMKTLDEKAKAEGLRTLYRECFAHPSVDGILMWGFWARSHWLSSKRWGIKGYTALWDADWNEMPAATAYRDLVFGQWWTDWEGEADEDGVCTVEAFYGDHRVTVGEAETTVELTKAEGTVTVELGDGETSHDDGPARDDDRDRPQA